jgi:5'-methylthioadenosine phosphorylase
MTMYPEVPLASELNIATANLAFVTDSDAGVAESADAADDVNHQLVLARLRDAQPRIIAAIETIIRALPTDFASEAVPATAVAEVLARPVTG